MTLAAPAKVPSWAPPVVAESAWVELQVALAGLEGPPVCAGDPGLWMPAGAVGDAVAVEGCSWCPLRRPCAAYAVAAGEPEGVWGGTTPEERRTASRAAS